MFLHNDEMRARANPVRIDVDTGLRRRPESRTGPVAAPPLAGLTAKVIDLARRRAAAAPATRRGAHWAASANDPTGISSLSPVGAPVGPAVPTARGVGANRARVPAPGQPYRLLISAESRPAARQVLALLWEAFAEVGSDALRISLQTSNAGGQPGKGRLSRGPVRITINLRCDRGERRHIVRFVQQAGELPGVRRVLWQSLPPTTVGPPPD